MKALKRAGDYADAERLLLALVGATENEARANRWPVALEYYNQLAIIYRKTKQPDKELQILERYAGCWRPEDGPLPADTVSARCTPVNGLAGCYVSTIGKPHEYFDLTTINQQFSVYLLRPGSELRSSFLRTTTGCTQKRSRPTSVRWATKTGRLNASGRRAEHPAVAAVQGSFARHAHSPEASPRRGHA